MIAILKSQPAVVVENGRVLDDVVKANRLTVSELHQAVRSSGVGDLSKVAVVVLETDGTLSVITQDAFGSGNAVPSTTSDQRPDDVDQDA